MRPIKRLLLFASELGVLVFGVGFSFAVVVAPAIYFDSRENSFLLLVLLSGLVLTIVGFVAIRRKTRPWKIEYDAVGRALTQAERRVHPSRARYKRIAKRILVWVPSVIAAAVLFFFPASSHLIRPGSQYLAHYRVSVPWTFAVIPVPGVSSDNVVTAFTLIGSNGKFGLTLFWKREIFSSEMGFGSQLRGTNSEFSNKMTELRHVGATQFLRRDFRLAKVALTCSQYLPPHDWPFRRQSIGAGALWQIDCETPLGLRGQHFYAWFRGREADIPAFYKIIEGVESVK